MGNSGELLIRSEWHRSEILDFVPELSCWQPLSLLVLGKGFSSDHLRVIQGAWDFLLVSSWQPWFKLETGVEASHQLGVIQSAWDLVPSSGSGLWFLGY